MREKLAEFVLDSGLVAFGDSSGVRFKKNSGIYKTKDSRAVHNKVLTRLSRDFVFDGTSDLFNCFGVDSLESDIRERQGFFSSLVLRDNKFLGKLSFPRASWKPKYDVVVVTESEESFVRLNKLNCGVVLLGSHNDVAELERYDVVQVVDCEEFSSVLERLPQSVFLDSIDDAYLERYLEELSSWRENFAILNGVDVSRDLRNCLDLLIEPFALLENKEGKIISEGEAESALEEINEEIAEKIKEMSITGEVMMKMLGEGKIPEGILEVIRSSIEESEMPEHIFNIGIPVSIDYKELEAQIKLQSANEFSDVANRIKRNASRLKGIPDILRRLEAEILVEDFCLGVAKYLSIDKEKMSFPVVSDRLLLEDGVNLFLRGAQEISFILNRENRCSILTGANSGGKTTLLEHLIQNVSLFRMGLPLIGKFECPLFDEVYYFAKTKGSASKGAFETLLTQMSNICVGGETADGKRQTAKVLILADEIEAVTEPGVAGKVIAATAEYFVSNGAYIVLATHLGGEISKNLPAGARVDGIEATGLDEEFNLIVNHNPVLGRLASSTPELIVERMARSEASRNKEKGVRSKGSEYFEFLFSRLKNK